MTTSNFILPVDSFQPDPIKSVGAEPDTFKSEILEPDRITSDPVKPDSLEGEKINQSVDVEVDESGGTTKADRKKKRGTTESGSGSGSGSATNVPKDKKPRVTSEKVEEVYQKILNEMVNSYSIGLTEVPMDTLVVKVGYKNVRSDAIMAAKKLMKAEGLAEIKCGSCMLTDSGREKLAPKAKPVANPEEAMKQFWDHLVTKLTSHKHTASDKALGSAKAMFNELKTGKAFSKKELLGMTHYSMDRSTGFPETLKAMRDLKFVEKKNGNISFTDKMFPFGRP